MLQTSRGEKVELTSTKEQNDRKEVFLGRKLQHRNHKLYEIDKDTFEFKEAVFEKVDYELGQKKPNRKVIIKANCFYLSALNKKSIEKKINSIKAKLGI